MTGSGAEQRPGLTRKGAQLGWNVTKFVANQMRSKFEQAGKSAFHTVLDHQERQRRAHPKEALGYDDFVEEAEKIGAVAIGVYCKRFDPNPSPESKNDSIEYSTVLLAIAGNGQGVQYLEMHSNVYEPEEEENKNRLRQRSFLSGYQQLQKVVRSFEGKEVSITITDINDTVRTPEEAAIHSEQLRSQSVRAF